MVKEEEEDVVVVGVTEEEEEESMGVDDDVTVAATDCADCDEDDCDNGIAKGASGTGEI